MWPMLYYFFSEPREYNRRKAVPALEFRKKIDKINLTELKF